MILSLAKSLFGGTETGNDDLSMIVIYVNDIAFSIQTRNGFSSIGSLPATRLEGAAGPPPQPNQGAGKDSSIANTPTAGNSGQGQAGVKPSAGVHVNKDMRVTRIVAGSPAFKAGLNVNDIIVAFDGIPVTDTATLKRLTDSVKVGDKKSLRVKRGNEIVDLTINY